MNFLGFGHLRMLHRGKSFNLLIITNLPLDNMFNNLFHLLVNKSLSELSL